MVKPMQLGHANIRVRDVERSEKFYTEVLGLHVTHRRGGTVFLTTPMAMDSKFTTRNLEVIASPGKASIRES